MAETNERKLRNRRRKHPKGRILRVSHAVFDTLNRDRGTASWDTFLRRLLGLPNRAGDEQPLVEGMLDTVSGRFFLKLPAKDWETLEQDAYEAAFLAAAKDKTKRIRMVSRPVRLREWPA